MEIEMIWNENALNQIPQKNGFRLRGLNMTRLETYLDAAFAFATTLLIISIGSIPKNYQELILALKDTPAFAASFASIAFLWISHRKWSHSYGLEDMTSTLFSLILIFIMLVYVYPLKIIYSALFAWISNGWLPTLFILKSQTELINIFIIYGLGYASLMMMFVFLYLHSYKISDQLMLNEREKIETRGNIVSFLVQASTGLLSACFARLMPDSIRIFAGFVYMLLPISMPLVGYYYSKKIKSLG